MNCEMIYLIKQHTEETWFDMIAGRKKKKKKRKEKKDVKLFLIFYILKERGVTYLPSHFHLIHFIYQSSSTHFMYQSPTHSFCHSFASHLFYDHRLSHSHSVYLVLLILHCISTTLSLSFFNQSCLWKLGVPLDETLIQIIYCIIWSWTAMELLLLVT